MVNENHCHSNGTVERLEIGCRGVFSGRRPEAVRHPHREGVHPPAVALWLFPSVQHSRVVVELCLPGRSCRFGVLLAEVRLDVFTEPRLALSVPRQTRHHREVVPATLLIDVHLCMRIAGGEVFGPVVSVISCGDERTDARDLGNDREHGLAG